MLNRFCFYEVLARSILFELKFLDMNLFLKTALKSPLAGNIKLGDS